MSIRRLSFIHSVMKGILVKKFGGVEEMVVSNSIPVPEITTTQVLIKVHCSGVNPVDTYVRSGNSTVLFSLPYTPGRDGAGVIEKVGNKVKTLKIGDRVFFSQNAQTGTLCEYTAMDEANVFPLAQTLSFEEGAALPIPYFTAHRALFFKANAKEGSKIFVHGASGAVGLAAIQIAKANNMTVVGTAGTEAGIDLVKSIGADAAYNHRDKNYLKCIENDHSDKFDIILEMLANVNLQSDLSLMRSRGITVVIGCRGDIKISPRLMMLPETLIVGCSLNSVTPEEWKVSSDAVIKGIDEGWVKPVIQKVYALEKAKDAHHDVINSKGALGKLIVKIQD